MKSLFRTISFVAHLIAFSAVAGGALWIASDGKPVEYSLKAIASLAEGSVKQEETVNVSDAVLEQLRGASELTTAISTVQVNVELTRQNQVFGLEVGRTTVYYQANGVVRAGIDLSELQPSAVRQEGAFVTLVLPRPRILDAKIDPDKSKLVAVDSQNWAPNVQAELQDEAPRKALPEIVEAACETGILDKATQQSEVVLSQVVQSVFRGARGAPATVTIQWQGASSCSVPVSPEPKG